MTVLLLFETWSGLKPEILLVMIFPSLKAGVNKLFKKAGKNTTNFQPLIRISYESTK